MNTEEKRKDMQAGGKARVGMVGLAGYGNVVRKGLKQCDTMELAAIWSGNPESVARSQREMPSKVCSSYEELLSEPIDGVIIVNPNYLHAEYGLKAAEAGKSILIEKPLANTVSESLQLVEAFRAADRLLGVKHLHRYSSRSRKMKEMIQSGALGRILSMEAYVSHSSSKYFAPDRWKRDPQKCPAAPLTQLGVHLIDTAMSFFGHPDWVQSHHSNMLGLSENVDCTVSVLGFGSVIMTVHAHYVVPSYDRYAVYGTGGVVVCDDTGLRWKQEGKPDFEVVDVPNDDGLTRALNAYGTSLLTGASFETTGMEAAYVVAALEGAILSASKSGSRVEIDSLMT